MITYSPLSAVTSAVILGGALTGCATYGKCNSDACQNDASISADVQALFDKHAELQPPNLVTVSTINGIVYLDGMVATDLQRATAESVALKATGVAMVVNDIAVSEK
jgi:osmotically-inducible protein OsmY